MMELQFVSLLNFLLLCILLCSVRSDEKLKDSSSRSITSAQFCGGCKITVEIMGRLASKGIKAMEKAGIDMSESLDVTKLSQDLCSQDEFKKYQPFAEYSCIKIMNDHKYHFLNVFAGRKSPLFSAIRGNMFKAKKDACVNETNACPLQVFSPDTKSEKERTKCNACYAISKDIEAAKFILKQPSKNGPIVEEVCENLGSNHLPYSWIETYCDEIMDDYADDIVAALDRRDRLQQNPHSSPASKIVCKDILGCGSAPWEKSEL